MEENKLQVINYGRVGYQDALKIQHSFLERRQQDLIPDTLLLLEHPPVLTVGRGGTEADVLLSREELEKRGVTVVHIERGGDVTYHGPGQMVGYIFMNVSRLNGEVGALIHRIEEVFIRLLDKEYGITAGRDQKHRGVWVENKKITAVGIAIKKRVTMHGFAFNINTDLSHFSWIVPCGITDRGVTSLEKLTGGPVDMETAKSMVGSWFGSVFGYGEVLTRKGEDFA